MQQIKIMQICKNLFKFSFYTILVPSLFACNVRAGNNIPKKYLEMVLVNDRNGFSMSMQINVGTNLCLAMVKHSSKTLLGNNFTLTNKSSNKQEFSPTKTPLQIQPVSKGKDPIVIISDDMGKCSTAYAAIPKFETKMPHGNNFQTQQNYLYGLDNPSRHSLKTLFSKDSSRKTPIITTNVPICSTDDMSCSFMLGFVETQIRKTENGVILINPIASGDSSSTIFTESSSLVGILNGSSNINTINIENKADERDTRATVGQVEYDFLIKEWPQLSEYFDANPNIRQKVLNFELVFILYTPASIKSN
jgi:hypothetical protein